jgi:hypothetical protein
MDRRIKITTTPGCGDAATAVLKPQWLLKAPQVARIVLTTDATNVPSRNTRSQFDVKPRYELNRFLAIQTFGTKLTQQ